MKKLVIIPAYNEEDTIVELCREIREKADGYDLIVINDGSEDRTHALCVENGIPVIDLPENLGIGGAVQAGFRFAIRNGYDVVVRVDGDGQHDPAFIGTMFEKMMAEGADLVIGSRFITGEGFQSTRLRRRGIRFLSWLIRLLTGRRITDPTSGFRMVTGELAWKYAADYPQDYPEAGSIVRLLRRGRKVIEVPVIMHERKGGSSSIGLRDSVWYMIKVTAAIIAERLRN